MIKNVLCSTRFWIRQWCCQVHLLWESELQDVVLNSQWNKRIRLFSVAIFARQSTKAICAADDGMLLGLPQPHTLLCVYPCCWYTQHGFHLCFNCHWPTWCFSEHCQLHIANRGLFIKLQFAGKAGLGTVIASIVHKRHLELQLSFTIVKVAMTSKTCLCVTAAPGQE